MLFSRKNIITTGKKPLYAASRVINASCGSATSVVARCWVHSTNKTTALLRKVKNSGLKRAYSTKSTGDGTNLGAGATGNLPLYRKVISAWTETPTKWYPIPLAVGALLLVAIQYRRKVKRAGKEVELDEDGREIIKLKGPWHVHVMGALPLRNMSRLWGYVNSLELPVWFRPYGYKFYAYAFGCNLDEIEPADLTSYPSLGAFFYRKLKDGARPVDKAILVSPADGTILHFGTIDHECMRVEQVKGITYHLDALLGVERPGSPVSMAEHNRDMSIVDDQEFAIVNGIEYTLDQLIGGNSSSPSTPPNGAVDEHAGHNHPHHPVPTKFGQQVDASVVDPEQNTMAHDAEVARDMGVKSALQRKNSLGSRTVRPGNSLFFSVIYLAPGDYHRFHSPTAWVVEKRRHFVGDLFSVSPWMAKRLENLFVLNERVALLGRWKYGFFSMVPVGATNVGSIKVNFDQALRTNVRGRRPPPGTYSEAVYSAASPILRGQPLTYAEEMGGFCLGSTIVLVFEAPSDFEFTISAGQKVKVGQRLGDIPENLNASD
ncbi:phosphatidylserine decarboxylase 1 [Coprinopsis cinerea okayama7|uniref:Phosphatidylserine decarboxylase proenzyme 1, mitochondrial n=1 Tax=Coprinopsis cinerea (strain Okayama-7 / 130 / ATCC MYA-4618 / FGSC 9003) TaxID=240176 RepID=A8N0A2_COPC7|nr:phosphatidylserine decarboxylase 1 [Coprinopsis cinerea okayama7\|eukprot:XP_001828290.1 phosphatidylserine decarboxylase 1 [Coprinopsis cinerea okayama7\